MALAIIFDSVGAGEWLVLLAVLLVVVGPRRLPSAARQFGSFYSKFRRAAENFRRQLLEMDTELEREVKSLAVEPPAGFLPDEEPVRDSEPVNEHPEETAATVEPENSSAADGQMAANDMAAGGEAPAASEANDGDRAD